MRSHVRTIVVLAAAVALVAVFFRDVDLWRVAADIARAEPGWLLFGLAMSVANLAIRAFRWQYLLEPLGRPDFAPAFRATVVGFAASAVLPARAGEVIRPYFLSRTQRHSEHGATMNTTGAFATIILERLLDVLTVIFLLALYVFVFGRDLAASHPTAFARLKWAAAMAAFASSAGMVALFVMAGSPERVRRLTESAARLLPAKVARVVARIAEKFAQGLGIVRRPSRLLIALGLSVPLWLSIGAGIWGVARAFQLNIPFTGMFLILAFLSLGVAVPTPGAVGGFHAAFRYAATTFFDARDEAAVGAAIVGHLYSVLPSLILGLIYAAQEGLSVAGMRHLADEAGQGGAA